MSTRVLILGGYGNFGTFIARKLSTDPNLTLILAGRSAEKARALAAELGCEWIALDIHKDFLQALAKTTPNIVIHTSGPFQGQEYHIAESCIRHGCHYIDLADDRDFVRNIASLDAKARAQNLHVISGASSVPCLSAAVIDHYQAGFQTLESIDYGITTAQRTGRGLATTKAVLSYVGKPFKTLMDGQMRDIYGWQDLRRRHYPILGHRLLSNCDIPDLDLFPARYPTLKTIRFSAGLEVPIMHIGLWMLSWLVRWRVLFNLSAAGGALLKTSNLFDIFGTDKSGFHMTLTGTDEQGQQKSGTFTLIAQNGQGHFIPCMPAMILTRKIACGDLANTRADTGAKACVDLITLAEYQIALQDHSCSFEYSEEYLVAMGFQTG